MICNVFHNYNILKAFVTLPAGTSSQLSENLATYYIRWAVFLPVYRNTVSILMVCTRMKEINVKT
jgi:hypothetical protein